MGCRGCPVAHAFRDARNDPLLAGWDSVALYANEPLTAGESFQVSLSLDVGGQPRQVDWQFRTRGTAG